MPGEDKFLPLETALDTWRDWGLALEQRPAVMGPVPGGRTNRSYQLRAPELGHDLLLRINNPQGQRLGIDRHREVEILRTVADAGLTLGACYWEPEQRFTVFRHIEARTWNAQDFADPGQRRRLLECLRLAHSLRPSVPRRRYYDYLNHYWQQLERAEAVEDELRNEWQNFVPHLWAFDQAGWTPCLTHHDLIPENVLETPERLYLIDWEYAAPGHPDIDYWCLDPALVREPFIHELANWTNDLWERVVRLH
ncbi:phosphotransferase [Marinimicrobium sp. C2-29]|uniref:phosphotransferase n=1 Tax=Marinimicrobium sp. C2-29 TaxID=3139825 RepID=UPI0031398380